MIPPLQRFKLMGLRSKKITINIGMSFIAKGLSIMISLLIVPLTINYINPTRYGIWLTLSSIIAWIGFFDLGLGNGMRNHFAEAKAKGDFDLARQYVSTTYFTIGGISFVLLLISFIINHFISWSSMLNLDNSYAEELKTVFAILAIFFCLNMTVKLFTTLLTADQNPGLSSLLQVSGQFLSLCSIYILTKVSIGSLLNLAVFYSGIPTLTILITSFFAYNYSKYSLYSPNIKYVRIPLIKDITNLGIQFFLIYLCMLVIFQIINIVISRELGPDSVTEYNIAFKYFNILHVFFAVIVTPFWSAFTEAYHKKDFTWMKKTKKMLERLWLLAIAISIVMVLLSNWFYGIWIGEKVLISIQLTIGMGIYILCQCLGMIYMQLINGIGTIRLQLYIYIFFTIIAWPLMTFSIQKWGLTGVLLTPSIVYLFQAIIAKIQIERILCNKAHGIWKE